MIKNLLLALILNLSVTNFSFGQLIYEINFEDVQGVEHVTIDTILNPDNIWQIGTPSKTIFNNALSPQKVIITDTINPYPINDTSVFIITNLANAGFYYGHTATLEGWYYVNSDSLNDFGKIEFSPNNGTTWIDLINDTIYSGNYWWYGYEKPVLTGSSNGWKRFFVSLAVLGNVFNIQLGDTVLYRFTFISDSIQTNKDGLMFDNLHFVDVVEGINEIQNQFTSKAFPTPTSDLLTIEFDNANEEAHLLTVFNSNGRNILIKKYTNQQTVDVDLSNYTSGTYYFMLTNQKNGQLSFGKIVKQ